MFKPKFNIPEYDQENDSRVVSDLEMAILVVEFCIKWGIPLNAPEVKTQRVDFY